MAKPILSIGIIFKNEIRCIERCLKSLQPLRDAIPCEVVMADTGSDDGSRAVAERYADILLDFPWVNDFAAARNAVMDRCSGQWYMSIDCDEWVDEKIDGYVAFLTNDQGFDFASVVIRNYSTQELERAGGYSDFLAARLLRMSTGLRYEGAIHEHWASKGDFHTMMIRDAVFHHDGYVWQNPELEKQKQERNMTLLREQLEADPDNLIVLTQCVESCGEPLEQEKYLRRAMDGVAEKRSQWELFGPPIYCYAVRMALRDKLPELEEWVNQAVELFPNSIFIRVELAYLAFGHYWNVDDYPKAVLWGERYLQGVEDYLAGRFNRADLLATSLYRTDAHTRLNVSAVLASGYLHEKQPEKCLSLMERLDPVEMEDKPIGDCVSNFARLYSEFGVDVGPRLLQFWERLREPVPDRERARQRERAFLRAGAALFQETYRDSERREFRPHAYAIFLALGDEYSLGNAAAILGETDVQVLEDKLGRVESWDEFPIQALTHGLEHGARFPLSGSPLKIEEMDNLIARLASAQQDYLMLALRLAGETDTGSRQNLLWVRGLLLTGIRTYPWNGENRDEEQGAALVRAFARVEKEFLPRYYAAELLQEDELFVLPAIHRFGWYCAQAFEALDQEDVAGYVRLLRQGLSVCEGAKDMVEFLLDSTPALKGPTPSAEMLALAEQIRTVLAAYGPDDPAVAALKQSEAYQKVAYLIEGPEPSKVGGQLQ